MDTGFFKWVWRFNAVVIAAAVTLMLCVVVWEMISSLRRNLFKPQTTNTLIAPTLQTDETEDEPNHAEVRRFFGPPLEYSTGSPYALPLRVEQEYDNRGISKSSVGNTVNYTIIDTETQTSRWLFPKGNRLILDSRPVTFRKQGQPEQNLGMILSIVESDSNADGRLSTGDTMTLYLVDPTWGEPAKITEGVKSILRIHSVSPSLIDLIFNTDDGTHAVRIDTATALILTEQVVTPQE